LVEGFVVDEGREEGEDVEEMGLYTLIKIPSLRGTFLPGRFQTAW
jgi:hypothetical protein